MSRRKNTAARVPFSVKVIRPFSDASGVDCLIDVLGFRFSANVLGDERVQILPGQSGSVAASRRAYKQACADFAAALAATVDATWREANRAMYAE